MYEEGTRCQEYLEKPVRLDSEMVTILLTQPSGDITTQQAL